MTTRTTSDSPAARAFHRFFRWLSAGSIGQRCQSRARVLRGLSETERRRIGIADPAAVYRRAFRDHLVT